MSRRKWSLKVVGGRSNVKSAWLARKRLTKKLANVPCHCQHSDQRLLPHHHLAPSVSGVRISNGNLELNVDISPSTGEDGGGAWYSAVAETRRHVQGSFSTILPDVRSFNFIFGTKEPQEPHLDRDVGCRWDFRLKCRSLKQVPRRHNLSVTHDLVLRPQS